MQTLDSTAPVRRPLTAVRSILLGTLTVGSLDGLDAIVFFGLRGVNPGRLFQGIASGLLGPAAFRAGPSTVALGVFLHYFIAFGIVITYHFVSRRAPALIRRPLVYGPLYGVLVYLIMNLLVIPLSALTRSPLSLPLVANGLFIHMAGVGLPAALFARASNLPALKT